MTPIEPGQLGHYFNAHSRALVLYVRQWAESEAAEDIVQEVFLRLMSQGSAPENIKGWLFRAVRNAAVDHWRRKKRRMKRLRQVAENHRTWFVARPSDEPDPEAIQSALTRLSPDQREIVVLRVWGDLTLQEISDISDMPVSTVFNRYRSALAAMRRDLEET